MSTQSGKRYEREVARRLRELGCTCERVTGSGGFTGTRSGDILATPRSVDARLDDALEAGTLPNDKLFVGEVKYSADASGFKSVYQRHLATCGLGTPALLRWPNGYRTGGPTALAARLHGQAPPAECSTSDSLPNTLADLLAGERSKAAPDFAAVRGSKRQTAGLWICAWQDGQLEAREAAA